MQVIAVYAFFQDLKLMPKLECLGRLTFSILLNVDGILSITGDWVKLKSFFWCQIDEFSIQF